MARPGIPDDERERIIAELRAGRSRNEIAREFGRSPDTIGRIARDIGHDFVRTATKKATEAAKQYGQAERLALANKALAKAEAMLDVVTAPREFKDWAVGYGVVMDKRRQEDQGSHEGADAIRDLVTQLRERRDEKCRTDEEMVE